MGICRLFTGHWSGHLSFPKEVADALPSVACQCFCARRLECTQPFADVARCGGDAVKPRNCSDASQGEYSLDPAFSHRVLSNRT
mmetsp:Transcript_57745/g.96072  ORF Transcript_57745/g.96072 Transcript_57745/m.96072 type:complete len:84 (-) Transcript_57745:418-669(-)